MQSQGDNRLKGTVDSFALICTCCRDEHRRQVWAGRVQGVFIAGLVTAAWRLGMTLYNFLQY